MAGEGLGRGDADLGAGEDRQDDIAFARDGRGFDVDDRDDAQAYVGSEILVNEKALPDLPEGEFYWRDLIGMTVVTSQGYNLGQVTDVMETGANDVLVVKANLNDGFGKKERLIPYLFEQVIESVSLENKQICVDWDPGF